jgi:hypothetical protein
MSTLTAPASAREALDMVRAGLIYLAAADPTSLPTETQADCLRELERDDAILTAAQASVLAGFTTAQGYCADADYSPRTWLMPAAKLRTRGHGDRGRSSIRSANRCLTRERRASCPPVALMASRSSALRAGAVRRCHAACSSRRSSRCRCTRAYVQTRARGAGREDHPDDH